MVAPVNGAISVTTTKPLMTVSPPRRQATWDGDAKRLQDFVMQFGCPECDRSFEELQMWSRLKNEGYKWICTSCNVPLVREQNERNMEYGCRNCNFTFAELQKWKWLKHCGDHWKCLACNGDITKHPREVYLASMRMAKLLWETCPLTVDVD